MKPFTNVSGAAVPLMMANIDTDVIIRVEHLTERSAEGLRRHAFAALRYQSDGVEKPDCPLNQPQFRDAPILLAGANFVLHAAGWLEGGLTASYEKFVLDFDQLGAMHVLAKGVDFSDNGQAMEAFHQVEPGGHFLGCAHTQRNFEAAFWRPTVADNKTYEQWTIEGSQDAAQRANRIWKKMLREYEAPPIDPAIDEALRDYRDRRLIEIRKGH